MAVQARPAGRNALSPAGRGGFSAAPAVTIATVEASAITQRLEAVGASRSRRSVTLIAEATGLVREVNFKAGDKVAKGVVLVRIEDEDQRIALARARAEFPIAKANSERFAELQKQDAASKVEAETAFNSYKAAQAALEAAQFAVEQRTIIAPFDGVAGLTTLEPGAYLRAGDAVATMDDISSIIVEFVIPQESAAAVRVGQKVVAVFASGVGEPVEGEVTAIDSRVDPVSRTLKIEAAFSNENGALLPGASYAVSTSSEGAPALAVPGLAVQWDRNGAYVWKLAANGAAVRTPVRVMQRNGERALILGDLAAGDKVIVEGADRVRPGMSFPTVGAMKSSAG
jgi:RND family efflux transporter MFP subunit